LLERNEEILKILKERESTGGVECQPVPAKDRGDQYRSGEK